MCFAFDINEGYYLPLNHRSPDCAFAEGLFHKRAKYPFNLFDQQRVTQDLINAGFESKPLIGHNIKFDLHVLRRMNIHHHGPVMDTLLVCQVEDPYRDNGLKGRVKEFFGYEPEEVDWTKQSDGFCSTDPRLSYTYAAADPLNTARLAHYVIERTRNTNTMLVCETVEFPLTPKLVEVEAFGVGLNTELLNKFSEEISPHMIELERLIRKYAKIDVNPASPEEKFNLLYRYLRVPYPADQEPDRKGATDDETLQAILAKIKELESGLSDCKKQLQAVRIGDLGVYELLENAALLMRKARFQSNASKYEAVTKERVQNAIAKIDEILADLPRKAAVVDMLMSWTKMQKLTTSFIDKLPEMRSDVDGRVHTEFKQILNSGRQAGKRPNLMQLPRDDQYVIAYPDRSQPNIEADVRRAILPPPGYKFVTADWDSMEMRMCAAISGCPVLMDVICGVDQNGKPYDPHIKTADMMGLLNGMTYLEAMKAKKEDGREGRPLHPKHLFVVDQRQKVKPIGFGLIYGITKWGLAVGLKCSPDEAQELMDKYFGVYTGVHAWLLGIYETAQDLGYSDTALGRRRLIPDEAFTDDQKLQHYLRACGNHQIQGGCADIAKFCEVQIIDALKGHDAFFCNFIHDEMILAVRDTPEELAYAGAVLESCMQKVWRGVVFSATAEVKENLSKKALDLRSSITEFGNPRFFERVSQTLGLSLDELKSVPW